MRASQGRGVFLIRGPLSLFLLPPSRPPSPPAHLSPSSLISHVSPSSILEAQEFEWESQLRFYWDREPDQLNIRQCTGTFSYGYEYMGLNGRLVITPLTDRIYLTLTQVTGDAALVVIVYLWLFMRFSLSMTVVVAILYWVDQCLPQNTCPLRTSECNLRNRVFAEFIC